ncbi:MAG: hypothetical protein IRZ16_14360 [Myxococcaceae bacterium]|nr:hypothetical protein [Myxococcaceae bacterium]
MRGVITGREVMSNLWLVWREFGFGCLCRCLWACVLDRRATFLELAIKIAGSES